MLHGMKKKVHTWCRHCHLCISAPMWREKRWLQGLFDPPSWMCSIVSFLNILAQKQQHFLELWNLRLVLFSYFTGSTVVCCRELAFIEIEPTLRGMLAENRAALLHKKHCLWDGKCSNLPKKMLDFSTPGSFKLVKWTFLYMLFNTVQYMRLN